MAIMAILVMNNNILIFLLKISLIGILIFFFSYLGVPVLFHFLFLYLEIELVCINDLNTFYIVVVNICCFFKILLYFFDFISDFVIYHKYRVNILFYFSFFILVFNFFKK